MLNMEEAIDTSIGLIKDMLGVMVEPFLIPMQEVAETFITAMQPLMEAFNQFFERTPLKETPRLLVKFIKTKKEKKDEYHEEEPERSRAD